MLFQKFPYNEDENLENEEDIEREENEWIGNTFVIWDTIKLFNCLCPESFSLENKNNTTHETHEMSALDILIEENNFLYFLVTRSNFNVTSS